MKYKLIAEDDNGFKVIHKFEEEQLNDILNHLGYFLKGCSFEFDGNLEIVKEYEDNKLGEY